MAVSLFKLFVPSPTEQTYQIWIKSGVLSVGDKLELPNNPDVSLFPSPLPFEPFFFDFL